MSEPWLATLRGQFQEIEARLASVGQPAEREAVKRDIIALFKRVDAGLADLGQMKEDIRGLVERYKQASGAATAAAAPQFTGARPAVRGVTSVRGRILPLIHLGALLEGTGCPEAQGEVAIVVRLDGRTLCLEVEEAETVLKDPGLAVSSGTALAWAVAVARTDDGLVPLLDLTALGARIKEDPAA